MPPLRFPTTPPLIPGHQVAPELGNRLVRTKAGEDKAGLMEKGEGVTETRERVEDQQEVADRSDGMSTKCAPTVTSPPFDEGGIFCHLPVNRGDSRNTLWALSLSRERERAYGALLTQQTRLDAPLPPNVETGVV